MRDLGRCGSSACLVWRSCRCQRYTVNESDSGRGAKGRYVDPSFLSGIRRVMSQAQQSTTTSTHLPSIWSLVTGIRKRATPATQAPPRLWSEDCCHPSSEKSSWIYSGTSGNRSQQLTGSSRSGDTDVVGKVQDDSEVGHQIGDPILST
jgi:hypothetical protein